ncbi:hypothetical protein LB505_008459 [Fusarium chuoi]|nr:hypothetical protein LB505_008459 [Fusarium chuoi]
MILVLQPSSTASRAVYLAIFVIDRVSFANDLAGICLTIWIGNQSFCDRLAAGLKAGSVKVSSAVKAITQKEGGACKFETINGDVYRAYKVIVSVPTPLYPFIHFEPSLPPAKKVLGESAKSGYYTKTVLVYAEPWWHSSGLSRVYSFADQPIVFTHDTCVLQDGQYSITCFHAGDSGRKWSRLPPEERKIVV